MMSLIATGTPCSGPRTPFIECARLSERVLGIEEMPCENLRLALVDVLQARASNGFASRLTLGDGLNDLSGVESVERFHVSNDSPRPSLRLDARPGLAV